MHSGSEIKVLSHDMISKSVNMKKTLGLLLQLFNGKFLKNIMSAVLQTIDTCMIIWEYLSNPCDIPVVKPF